MSHVIAALIIFHLRPPTSALTLHPLQNLLGVTLEPLSGQNDLGLYPYLVTVVTASPATPGKTIVTAIKPHLY